MFCYVEVVTAAASEGFFYYCEGLSPVYHAFRKPFWDFWDSWGTDSVVVLPEQPPATNRKCRLQSVPVISLNESFSFAIA